LAINSGPKSRPGNISAWSGETDDQLIADRIGHAGHDDRNYVCCLLGCAGRCRAHHDNDVNLEPNQIVRDFPESLCIPFPEATLDSQVRTLSITKLPQPLVKSNGPGRIRRAGI
jgi:hypothetical protein